MEYCFVELDLFTRKIVRLGLEDDLRELEDQLRHNPLAGAVDPGTCGLRKIRMGTAMRGRGKRSGARIHYLHVPSCRVIYLFNVYLKEEQGTLTPEQKKMLCALVVRFTVD